MPLRRQLGLLAVTTLVVGEVIAIGIFLTPAGMARSLGSPLWLLIVWLLMGFMALSGALCYGELAARAPEAGGGYVYLREAYGPAVAFLYGWKCMLVMDPGITAALAVGLASYVGYALGLAGPSLKLSTAQRQTIYQSVSATQKNNPAPTGFRAAIGAQVPDGIPLQPISTTLATLIPETAQCDVAMVEKQVVLVDPKARRVVAVVVAQ